MNSVGVKNAVVESAALQRELRRAVATLLENPIEDIEFIWNSLSREERAKLRPVIEAASGISEKASALAALPEHGVASSDWSSDRIARIIALMEQMPASLTIRLYASLDARARSAAGSKLQALLFAHAEQVARANALTDHARAAWRELCLEHAISVEPAAHESGPMTPATPLSALSRARLQLLSLTRGLMTRRA